MNISFEKSLNDAREKVEMSLLVSALIDDLSRKMRDADADMNAALEDTDDCDKHYSPDTLKKMAEEGDSWLCRDKYERYQRSIARKKAVETVAAALLKL